MNKKILIFIVLFILLIVFYFVFFDKIFLIKKGGENNQNIFNNTTTNSDIIIDNPKQNQNIKSPLNISGKARGYWFFEAQFTAELYDENNNLLGQAILTAQDEWMTENFVPFQGELVFKNPTTKYGKLLFLSGNPSGLAEYQKVYEIRVEFEKINTMSVLLYYYNPEKDKDENGNIKCSKDGLIAIKKEIPITQIPIKDTIDLLIKGKENLNKNDLEQGITTEFPLDGFKLKSVNLKPDKTLILEFYDPLNKSSGGACRASILWFQIEQTAKQFNDVNKVEFKPEYLFQP